MRLLERVKNAKEQKKYLVSRVNNAQLARESEILEWAHNLQLALARRVFGKARSSRDSLVKCGLSENRHVRPVEYKFTSVLAVERVENQERGEQRVQTMLSAEGVTRVVGDAVLYS